MTTEARFGAGVGGSEATVGAGVRSTGAAVGFGDGASVIIILPAPPVPIPPEPTGFRSTGAAFGFGVGAPVIIILPTSPFPIRPEAPGPPNLLPGTQSGSGGLAAQSISSSMEAMTWRER